MRTHRTRSAFAAGLLAGAIALGAWYAGCPHQKASDGSGSTAGATARLLPHPAFAFASTAR